MYLCFDISDTVQLDIESSPSPDSHVQCRIFPQIFYLVLKRKENLVLQGLERECSDVSISNEMFA